MARPTTQELRERGRAERKRVGRRAHGSFRPAKDRPDPVAILTAQDAARLPDLVGLRYARMATSPLAFLRGAAAVMAADLVAAPATELITQLCGDAHVGNIETYATPERRLVLDICDFDETVRGPFEWDLKRMVSSLVLAARQSSYDTEVADAAVSRCVAAYRRTMRAHRSAGVLDVWYASVDEHEVLRALGERIDAGELGKELLDASEQVFERARRRNSRRAARRLLEEVDGRFQMREDPPVLSREVLPPNRHEYTLRFLGGYRMSLPTHLRLLLERYEVVDAARRVVGVGSVGTRCFVIVLHGRDEDDPLVLQLKEAGPSVWEPYVSARPPRPHGRRVVEGQRTMQAASDLFLGWTSAVGPDGVSRDYYVRQFRDMKGSVDVEALDASALVAYAGLCGRLLANAHARGGQAAAISGYLGKGEAFVEAMVRFAHTYADVTERDHQRLLEAIAAGRVPHDPA